MPTTTTARTSRPRAPYYGQDVALLDTHTREALKLVGSHALTPEQCQIETPDDHTPGIPAQDVERFHAICEAIMATPEWQAARSPWHGGRVLLNGKTWRIYKTAKGAGGMPIVGGRPRRGLFRTWVIQVLTDDDTRRRSVYANTALLVLEREELDAALLAARPPF